MFAKAVGSPAGVDKLGRSVSYATEVGIVQLQCVVEPAGHANLL